MSIEKIYQGKMYEGGLTEDQVKTIQQRNPSFNPAVAYVTDSTGRDVAEPVTIDNEGWLVKGGQAYNPSFYGNVQGQGLVQTVNPTMVVPNVAPTTQPKVTDIYAQQLAQAIAQQEAAAKAALEAKVNQGVGKLEAVKPTINTAYKDSSRQAYTLAEKNKIQTPQRLAAMGITGGAAERNIRDMDLAYANTLNQGRTERDRQLGEVDNSIANLRATGDISIAENANVYAQKLQDEINRLISEQRAIAQQELAQENWQANFDQGVNETKYRNDLEIAKQLSAYGDFSGYEKLGYDTTQMKSAYQAELTAKNKPTTKTTSTPKITETQATVALQAYLNGDRSPNVVAMIEAFYGLPAATVARGYGSTGTKPEETQPTPVPSTTTQEGGYNYGERNAFYDVGTQAKIYQLRQRGISDTQIAKALREEGKNPALYGIRG